MTLEQELPRLFDELADAHKVGPAPSLDEARWAPTTRPFARRSESVTVDGGEPDSGALPDHGPWGRRVAVAAGLVLAVGGVVAVANWNRPALAPSEQPSTVSVPSPWDLNIDDRQAVSLDALVTATPHESPDGQFLALDETELPPGITVTSASSSTTTLDAPSGPDETRSYQHAATLAVDGVDTFYVVVDDGRTRHELAPPAVECGDLDPADEVDVGGIEATTDGSTVCWEHPDGYTIRIEPIVTDGEPTAGRWTSLRVAEEISIIEVDELPRREPRLAAEQPADIAFAGSLSGVGWSAAIDPGPLRAMFIYVNGARSAGFEHSNESQPDAIPVTSIQDDTISGVPGYGVLVYGLAPPQAAHLVAATDEGETVRVPMVQRELESFFALPIPDGVNVVSLTFTTDHGASIATVPFPDMPIGLDGTYNGWLTSTAANNAAATTSGELPVSDG